MQTLLGRSGSMLGAERRMAVSSLGRHLEIFKLGSFQH